MIESTTYATEEPGAYHADVPNSLVNVAPPTMVDFTTSSIFFSLMKSVKGSPLYLANLFKVSS